MNAADEAWDALAAVCRENDGLASCLSEIDRRRLTRYWELLTRWGPTLNLSRRRDAIEWARFDVADAFLGLRACAHAVPEAMGVGHDAQGGAIALFSSGGVMDVGSGAGFPGLALAMQTHPGTQVRWVETLQRRTSFLQRVARELELSHVRVHHQRVEEVREPAAVVTVRATFPWQELGVLRAAVAPGGQMVAFLGREPAEGAWRAQVESWGWQASWLPYAVEELGPRAIGVALRPHAGTLVAGQGPDPDPAGVRVPT